jgi:hypothetical protein
VAEIPYRDELLADRTVHRGYADGREEWRTRDGGVVRWRDNRGRAGTDELLGQRIIKRTYADGGVVYARDVGYGRTLWRDGTVTVNRTSFRGRFGMLLAAVAGSVVLGSMVPPPAEMTAAEEEALRQQQASSGSSGGGGDGGGGGYSDWDDSDDGGDADGDFG